MLVVAAVVCVLVQLMVFPGGGGDGGYPGDAAGKPAVYGTGGGGGGTGGGSGTGGGAGGSGILIVRYPT